MLELIIRRLAAVVKWTISYAGGIEQR